jgi:hypothetical protein
MKEIWPIIAVLLLWNWLQVHNSPFFYISDNYFLAEIKVVRGRVVFLASCSDLRYVKSHKNESPNCTAAEVWNMSNWALCDWHVMRNTAVISRPLGRICNSVLQLMQLPHVDLSLECLSKCTRICIVLIPGPSLLPPSTTMACVLKWSTQGVMRTEWHSHDRFGKTYSTGGVLARFRLI